MRYPPPPADLHSLMYGGGATNVTTKIVAHTQSWFCALSVNGSPGCALGSGSTVTKFGQPFQIYQDHNDVQYTAWNQNTMDARTVDMWDRGVDIVSMDWYGGPNNCPCQVNGSTTTCPSWDLQQYQNTCKSDFLLADRSYQYMLNSFQNELPQGANMSFYLTLDVGGWFAKQACGAALSDPLNGSDQPWCVANKIIADLNYANTGTNEAGVGTTPPSFPYFSQSNYASYNGKPIIAFFEDEGNYFTQCGTDTAQVLCSYDAGGDLCPAFTMGTTNWQAGTQYACWAAVWQVVRTQLRAIFPQDGFGNDNFYMIFYTHDGSGCPTSTNSSGLAHGTYADGCYTWPQPETNAPPSSISLTPYNQLYDDQTATELNPSPQSVLRSFYSLTKSLTSATAPKAPNGSSILVMGSAFKGFDDTNFFSNDGGRVLSQSCGQTWLNTWNEMTFNGSPNSPSYGGTGAYFSAIANPLPFMQIATWDDYEEGTEIETGIDNCVSSFTTSISGSELTWNIIFNVGGSENTVDHYESDYSTDGTTANLQDSGVSVRTGTYSYNLNGLAGDNFPNPTLIYVQAVGKPSIANHMSQSGLTYNPTPSITSVSPNYGPAGTLVTITGSNFGSIQGTVTFNGVPLTPIGGSWSSNSIQVNIPSGAQTGYFVVTTAGASGLTSNGVRFWVAGGSSCHV